MIMESDELIETNKPSKSIKSINENGASGFQRFWAQEANRLIVFTLAGVIFGVSLGILLISVADLSEDVIGYIEYPGEIMMRALKCVVMPLIITSLISGLASMDPKTSGKLGIRAMTYYLSTTMCATILGMILVSISKPGSYAEKQLCSENITANCVVYEPSHVSTVDTFLDIGRNLCPDNVFAATFQLDKTVIEETKEGAVQKKRIKTASPNVLGLISCALLIGICMQLQQTDENVVLVIKLVDVSTFLKTTPIGIGSLICGSIVKYAGASTISTMIGIYTVTILGGLAFHALVILPLAYFFFTRNNPFRIYSGLASAVVTAFGTSSSAATLPQTMSCLEENLKMDIRVTRFMLPLGATMNMDGTALLEGVAAITISQIYSSNLQFSDYFTISLTATLASVGAASIPSAGLVTLVLVVSALGLPTTDIGILFSVEWVLDRCRTVVNVLGDSIGVGIINHLSRDDLLQ
ncbi:Oidioi.mRNA.OKI2018_I69.chr2.g4184.t1.cds [Oikopleura dioica]|uniref:Amino acid transporter n=1 Tax=Oikopleura dioica TaxID=34765 RepID=A0ABN7SWJ3_OIKDI|nr:Oidioi.mRNA.OKI2018_I69.chr2.g4184.t1.cds [Oikopleura dioica]